MNTPVNDRTTQIYNELVAEDIAETGQPVTDEHASRLLEHARFMAEREERDRRHWDHIGIRPAEGGSTGQPSADLLFYSGKTAGMVSVITLTHAELLAVAEKGLAYLEAAGTETLPAEDEAVSGRVMTEYEVDGMRIRTVLGIPQDQ
jgi:hypothetical protein